MFDLESKHESANYLNNPFVLLLLSCCSKRLCCSDVASRKPDEFGDNELPPSGSISSAPWLSGKKLKKVSSTIRTIVKTTQIKKGLILYIIEKRTDSKNREPVTKTGSVQSKDRPTIGRVNLCELAGFELNQWNSEPVLSRTVNQRTGF